MIRLTFAAILVSVCAGGAWAQEQKQSPQVRALSSRLLAEINSGVQCSEGLFTLQDQIAALKAENESLRKRVEPDK